jgi:hypothetical protein
MVFMVWHSFFFSRQLVSDTSTYDPSPVTHRFGTLSNLGKEESTNRSQQQWHLPNKSVAVSRRTERLLILDAGRKAGSLGWVRREGRRATALQLRRECVSASARP